MLTPRTEYGIQHLRNAIQVMRDACDDAERELKHEDQDDLKAAYRKADVAAGEAMMSEWFVEG